MSANSKIRRTLIWSSVDRLGQAALNFLIGILLARLLTPDDFGLMAGVTVFIALSYVLVDFGLGKALARTRNAGESHFATIMCANLVVSCLLYLIAFFAAPAIACYMNMPALTLIVRILFISLLFNAFYIVPHTRLQMAFRFDIIACVNLCANFLSAVAAAIAAFNGMGVWALVIHQMTYHVARLAGFVAFGPGFKLVKPSWSIIKDIMPFSTHIALSGLLNALFGNIYLFIVAKFFPLYQAGQYTHAHRQSDNANFTMLSILESTTYNILAEHQRDENKFTSTLRHLMRRVSIIAMPAMMLIIFVARPACLLLFGGQWLPSVPYFQLICLANTTATIALLCTNALNVKGLSNLTFRLEVFRKGCIALTAAIALPHGIVALLIGYVAACLAGTAALIIAVHKRTEYHITQLITDISPAIAVSALMAIAWTTI